MAKKVIANIKLQITAGKATPSPPVGPALGQHGVNIMEFCKAYNAMTQKQEGMIVPVVITVYADRSYYHLVLYIYDYFYHCSEKKKKTKIELITCSYEL